jgi:15-hydroxyprostaglandin dehydrogenase (NAD)
MGVAVVKHLVEEGWNVTIVDIDQKLGLEVASQLGDQILFVRANVADYEQQASAFEATWARWGRLDFGIQATPPCPHLRH